MRRVMVALVAGFVLAAGASTMQDLHSPMALAQAPTAKPCAKPWQHNRFVRHHVWHFWVGGHGGDFHAQRPTKRAVHKADAMRACARASHNKVAHRKELHYWHHMVRRWRVYRQLDRITACGEWVVCGVVDNESATSGYYRAYNGGGCSGHGCLGAYQIDQAHYSSVCSRLSRVRWQIWAQHECAYIILRSEGLGAWAGDGAYL